MQRGSEGDDDERGEGREEEEEDGLNNQASTYAIARDGEAGMLMTCGRVRGTLETALEVHSRAKPEGRRLRNFKNRRQGREQDPKRGYPCLLRYGMEEVVGREKRLLCVPVSVNTRRWRKRRGEAEDKNLPGMNAVVRRGAKEV